MSNWTYITGNIVVSPMGRTQAEKKYILDTVLNHLPRVEGSEGDMNIYTIKKKGCNSMSSHDEFGQRTNNLQDHYGNKSREKGCLQVQDEYIIVVDGALRDREFNETYRAFIKWIVRLGKRISINDVLVKIEGYDKTTIVRDSSIKREKYSWKNTFGELFENPSWSNNTGEPTWCQYLMYDNAKGSSYPMMLMYKYISDGENDKEAERRIG